MTDAAAGAPTDLSLDEEDTKLVVLARGALARAGQPSGAAVRDTDGRTYAGAAVTTDALVLSALQVAVATALSSGASGFEAAVLVGGDVDDPGRATLAEISAESYLVVTDGTGTPTARVAATEGRSAEVADESIG